MINLKLYEVKGGSTGITEIILTISKDRALEITKINEKRTSTVTTIDDEPKIRHIACGEENESSDFLLIYDKTIDRWHSNFTIDTSLLKGEEIEKKGIMQKQIKYKNSKNIFISVFLTLFTVGGLFLTSHYIYQDNLLFMKFFLSEKDIDLILQNQQYINGDGMFLTTISISALLIFLLYYIPFCIFTKLKEESLK